MIKTIKLDITLSESKVLEGSSFKLQNKQIILFIIFVRGGVGSD